MVPGRAITVALLVVIGATAACGKGTSSPTKRDAAVTSTQDAAPAMVELAERPLGLPDLAAHQWRDRGGHASFREARAAEARQDWPAVTSACRAALAADPTHLEASWLLAAALGRQNKNTELVEPLQTAVAGDFAKWGKASLELPALAAFRETPTGKAWIERVDRDRGAFAQAIGRGTVVIADGDLFAIDPQSQRWFRLTRTGGTVIAGLYVPSVRKLAYVARVIPRYGKATKQRELGVGVVDFGAGTITRAIELGTKKAVTVAYSAKAPVGFYVLGGAAKKPVWRRLEDDYKLVALPPKTARPPGSYLEVKARSGAITQLPIKGIVADWDDKGLASAIRLSASNRVLTVPSPGLIDGNTAAWSPQKTHLAFVAQLDETCTPGTVSAAAVVADVTTGKTTELVRATKGLAIEWISDRQLAVAADDGVVIYDLDGAPPRTIEGARKLATPKKRTRCAEGPDLEVDDPAPDSDEASDAPVERPDAGVVEPIQSGGKSTPENR
jgi:hypothetical protein